MKHLSLLTITLTLTLSLSLSAQHKYIPFPDSNAIWVQRELGEDGKEEKQFVDSIVPYDTTINGKLYHTIQHYKNDKGEVVIFDGIRQDTTERKVYHLYYQKAMPVPIEKLLYDFSVKVGDTVPELVGYGYAPNRTVSKIDSILLPGGYHHIFYFNRPGTLEFPYIEGIGCISGLLGNSFFFEGGTELLCFRLNGKSYYPDPNDSCMLPPPWTGSEELPDIVEKVTIVPNPLTSASVLKIIPEKHRISTSMIYDHKGEIIYEKQNLATGEIPVGSIIRHAGFYYYRIELDSGKILTGKFMKI